MRRLFKTSGFSRRSSSISLNKVPFLGDIPLLGWLFKTESTGRTKTEVIMLVTPRIIENEDDIDTIRREIINNMNLLDVGQTGRFLK